MADEIIEELWKIKDGIACEHGYDLDSLTAYLKAEKRTEKRKQSEELSERRICSSDRKE